MTTINTSDDAQTPDYPSLPRAAFEAIREGDDITFTTHAPGLGHSYTEPITATVRSVAFTQPSDTYVALVRHRHDGEYPADAPRWIATIEAERTVAGALGGQIRQRFQIEQYDGLRASVTRTRPSIGPGLGGAVAGYLTSLDDAAAGDPDTEAER